VEIVSWLTPVVALIGVWLGGALSGRAQDRSQRRADSQRWVDMRRVTYGGFLSAARALRAYITEPTTSIGVKSHPDGLRLIPTLEPAGVEKRQAVERAFAEIQLAAEREETIAAAALVYRMTYRLAAARALFGLPLPGLITGPFYDAMRGFINAARDELHLRDIAVDGFGPEPVLAIVDRDLRDVFDASP
jgi:hypothetical protein